MPILLVMSKKSNPTNDDKYPFALLILAIGLLAGYVVGNLMQTKNTVQTQATTPAPQQIEQTKNDIAKLYKDKTVDACWKVNNGSSLGSGKYDVSYRYLRINEQLDRAIITDCGENDKLLYKNKAGQWAETNVNLTLNNRVNPLWQEVCKVQDITTADDQVRTENSSIDEVNLQECERISLL